jgi:glycyl-tRNA synthetase beta chain
MALRRTAIAIIRLIVEGGLRVNIREIIRFIEKIDSNLYYKFQCESPDHNQFIFGAVDFIEERFKYYLEDKGYERKYIDAVIWPRSLTDLQTTIKNIDFIVEFLKTEKGQKALYVYSRCFNIIGNDEIDYNHQRGFGSTSYSADMVIHQHLEKEEEKNLHDNILLIQSKLLTVKERLEALAELKDSLDLFFDHVLVNTDNPDLTLNRKNLLRMITKLFDQYADFSKLKNS